MKLKFSCLLILLLLLGSGCAAKEYETAFFAMDTYMTIRAYGPHAEAACTEAERAVFDLENRISRTRETSDVARLNAAGEAQVSPETLAVLRQAKESCIPGVFDITIAAVSDLWGIGTENACVPAPEALEAARATVGIDNLSLSDDGTARLSNGAQLDLGGVGKGVAADLCAEALRTNGVESALAYLGGNIYALGSKPDGSAWTVGIADPDTPAAYLATIAVRDTSVVTTGDYERFFMENGVRYHHVFDPSTGEPARSGLRSVTVVSENSALADAHSTALFVMGLEKGLAYCAENQLDAVFITDDRQVYVTEGLLSSFTFCGEEAGYVLAS